MYAQIKELSPQEFSMVSFIVWITRANEIEFPPNINFKSQHSRRKFITIIGNSSRKNQ